MTNPSHTDSQDKFFLEPTMSDKTLMLDVEDLIALAFGPLETNAVNFTMMQIVINTLVRHMRFLDKHVQIRFTEDEKRIRHLKRRLLRGDLASSSDSRQDSEMEDLFLKTNMLSDSQTSDVSADYVERKKKDDAEIEDKKKARIKKGTEIKKDADALKDIKAKTNKSKGKSRSLDNDSYDVRKPSKRQSADDLLAHTEIDDGEYKKKTREAKSAKSELAEHDGKRKGKNLEVKGSGESLSEKGKSVYAKSDLADYDGKRKSKKTKVKERDESISEKGKPSDKYSKNGGFGGISVKETVRKGGNGPNDTVLIVEKGPTTRASNARIGNIEVVTRSQLQLLEYKVKKIMKQSEPMSIPFMPDNKQLKGELVKGKASVSGTMEATQLSARVNAAETALTRMAELLTQLAEKGSLPPESINLIDQLKEEQRQLSQLMSTKVIPTKKTPIITPGETTPATTGKAVATEEEEFKLSNLNKDTKAMGESGQPPRKSAASKTVPSILSSPSPLVTRGDLNRALENLKRKLLNHMNAITAKSTEEAAQAANIVKSTGSKLDVSLKVQSRIELVNSFATEQADLMTGIDAGLSTQLKNFEQQLDLARKELKNSLQYLNSRNSIESSAVTSLRNTHKMIEMTMVETMHDHKELIVTHRKLEEDIENMKNWMNLIRDEKTDRQELLAGLQYKVNLSRLEGLLFEDQFEVSHKDFNKRLDTCHESFDKNNAVYMGFLAELMNVTKTKAALMDVHYLRDQATDSLNEIKTVLDKLEVLMGDLQMQKLTREFSIGVSCASCRAPALMPPFAYPYAKKEEPITLPAPPDTRNRFCHRWVGGSHTLITNPFVPKKASPLQVVPTRQYTTTGVDGPTYWTDEELQPCVECTRVLKDSHEDITSQQPPPPPPPILCGPLDTMEVGAGDQLAGDQLACGNQVIIGEQASNESPQVKEVFNAPVKKKLLFYDPKVAVGNQATIGDEATEQALEEELEMTEEFDVSVEERPLFYDPNWNQEEK